MDPLNQQPAPTEAPIDQSGPVTPSDHKKIGPIVSILVVILVLIIGALYIFASRINNFSSPDTMPADENAIPTETVKPVINTSDEIDSIEADLEGSIQGLDSQNF